MWTSSSNTSYLGVSVHYLDANFNPVNKCLNVQPAPGSHMAEFISQALTGVIDDWSLKRDADLHVITDSGANIKKAVIQLMTAKWRPCVAHKLHLCVTSALGAKEVTELPKILSKARSIVGHFRHSPLATTQLDKAQTQLNLPHHKLIQDCATRWNLQVGLSTYILSPSM